jgi:hypothetical protein
MASPFRVQETQWPLLFQAKPLEISATYVTGAFFTVAAYKLPCKEALERKLPSI